MSAQVPRSFRVDDFHLSLAYQANGGTEDPLPGFRLRAYFANEGEAFGVLGGGRERWNQGIRLQPQTVTNTLVTLASDPLIPDDLMNWGGTFATYTETALRNRHAAMVRKTRELREQLAAAEAALEAEGLPRDA